MGFKAVAQEEFEMTHMKKTAKAEVIEELRDEVSTQEWMTRQLVSALDLLEACQIFSAGLGVEDIVCFFEETIRHITPFEKRLRGRAVGCLQILRTWGLAA